MNLKRLAMCVAAFALMGGVVFAEDVDVRALEAKLAAQEARLNDLQAKMYGASGASCGEDNIADGMTSLRKNAVVTIGGTLNTRYFSRNGNVKLNDGTGNFVKVVDTRLSDFQIADANIDMKIDVNDYFDAYVLLDLQSVGDDDASTGGVAKNYWIRWKNVCNSGFGVLLGRDDLKFGGVQPYGILGGYAKNDDGMGQALGFGYDESGDFGGVTGMGTGEGMFLGGSLVPTHTMWDYSRVTQINPYWENSDGSLKAELSFLQSVDTVNGMTASERVGTNKNKYRSINFGFGSMTGRVAWTPIEDLTLTVSAMNLRAKHNGGAWDAWPTGSSWSEDADYQTAANNTSVNIGVEYRPCFFNRLNLWATYTHSWNDGWVKDLDNDIISGGFGFDFTDQLTWFVQGDYMRTKNGLANTFHKANSWSAYTGFIYTLPYGVNFEVGYKHDRSDVKARSGFKVMKNTADTVYAHVGFDF